MYPILQPSQTEARQSKRLRITLSIARKASPSLKRARVSYPNVEKVVKPPRIPSMRKSLRLGPSSEREALKPPRIPIRRQPLMFTKRVP